MTKESKVMKRLPSELRDKRFEGRRAVYLGENVTCHLSCGEYFQKCIVVDLSTKGAALVSKGPLAPGTKIRAEVQLTFFRKTKIGMVKAKFVTLPCICSSPKKRGHLLK